MLDTDTATSLAIGLFALTAVLLLFANRAGQTRLGRFLAVASIASVCGANYSMVAAYNGEPPPPEPSSLSTYSNWPRR